MRNILYVILLLLLQSNPLTSQTKGVVNIDLFPLNIVKLGIDPNFQFSLEPKYYVSDNIAVGIKLSSNFLGREIRLDNSAYIKLNSDVNYGGVFFFDYHVKAYNKVKFFGGIGLGIYSMPEEQFASTSGLIEIPQETKMGAQLRGGIKFSELRLLLEYNVIGENALSNDLKVINRYYGVGLGVNVGKWGNS